MAFFGSVVASDALPCRGSVESIASEGPAAAIPGPLSLEHSIRELRRYSESEYTSVTVEEPSDDTSSQSRPAEHSAALEKLHEEPQPSRPLILFREFSGDGFRIVEQVDADQPDMVASVARELKRKGKALLSVDLDHIQPGECFKAARASGTNAIIVLPSDNVTVSQDLRSAVGQLPRGRQCG